MPNKCCLINCGAIKSQNQPNLSLHRLPRNKAKKQLWLDAIREENMCTKTKDIYICSLHFEQSSFNRTLDVLRLRDDAVPTLLSQHRSISHCPASTLMVPNMPSGSQNNPDLFQALKKNQKLQEKILSQKEKIKCLNETICRQKIKIEKSKAVIIELREKNLINNDNAIVFEQCAGPKDFLLRQSYGIRKQYTAKLENLL